MRKLAITMALASTVLATPAFARDNSGYVGLEGGLMIVEDYDAEFAADDGSEVVPNFLGNAVNYDHKVGWDIDVVGGYDFGAVRLEGELGYKRARLDDLTIAASLTGIANEGPYDLDGDVSVLSFMVNGLLDFGDDNGWSGYVGPGFGIARVKYSVDGVGDSIGFDDQVPTVPFTGDFDGSDSSSGFAWQVIAGVRTAISQNLDLGLKYRFFNVRKVNIRADEFDGTLEGRFRSHSLLLSLIYNFAAPVVPPPPPPATQTCPDGSVILATDTCPAPPPPPPPPPPEPVRG